MSEEMEFSKNLLRGAHAIAEFIYGDKKYRRKVFHLASTSKMPTFKLGSMICARKSVLLKWIEEQEQRHNCNHRKQPENAAVDKVEPGYSLPPRECPGKTVQS
jgi:hypothetical protein